MPENLSNLEELSDILDAIFRQKVSLTAAEAFIDYWNMTYSRIQVPKQGWPPAIQHCLSSVGLLPEEAKVVVEEEESILEKPELATTVPSPVPQTPHAVSSFTTPPNNAIPCEAFTSIQSPQRPQKLFGPFPIIPSSPMSPLLGRSSGLSENRTPLSSIQLCKTPPKRRRLAVDHENGDDDKENVVVSVVDRIAAMNSGTAKKRRCGEMEVGVEEQKSGSSAKKLKYSMRPRTRSATKNLKVASQHASPACSVASSKGSEDERQWVDATLRIPFPVLEEPRDDACGGELSSSPVPPPQPRRHVRTGKRLIPYVLVPSRKRTMEPKGREHTTSLDGTDTGVDHNLSSSSKTLDMRQLPTRLMTLRRSMSNPESMIMEKRKRRESDAKTLDMLMRYCKSNTRAESMLVEKKRKRRESDAGDDSPDLYDLVGSSPLPALHLPIPPPPIGRFRKAYTLPSSDSDISTMSMSSSSDDDPYIGQVTPRHLISPVLQRTKIDGFLTSQRKPLGIIGIGERYGDLDAMMMPGSDDSVTTSGSETESPMKARQMKMRWRALSRLRS